MSARCSVRVVTVAAAVVLLLGTGLSQTKGGGTAAPPAGAAGSPGTIGNPGTTNFPTGTTNNTNNTYNTPMRTIMLTGRVLLEEGTPPPEPAKIQRVCANSTRAEGYTDAQGYFSIQIGNEGTVFQDASEQNSPVNGGMPRMGGQGTGGTFGGAGGGANNSFGADQRLMNCDLRADLSGFRSQLVSLANRHALDSPDLGIIYLHRQAPGEGNIVSANSLSAPKDARKAFEKGQELLKKKKVDEAVKDFQKAVMLYPSYSSAWCELGKIELARGQRDIARGSFNEAIKADPKYVEPYVQLSRLAADAKNWQELAEVTGKVLELDSFDYPEEFFFNAAAHFNLHNLDEAEKSLRSAEKLDSRHQFPEILYLKGLILARRRDYSAAADELRAYLKLTPDSPNVATARTQLAEIEKVLAQSATAKPADADKQ